MRSVGLRLQGQPVAARHHLERHRQRPARGVPFKIDLGTVDRNAGQRIVGIDDEALVHLNAAIEHARQTIRADVGVDASRKRQVGLIRSLAQPHRQHEVVGGDVLRLDVEDAAPLRTRRHRRTHHPRPFDGLRTERDGQAAALRAGHAEIDVGERPLLAVALVVDGEVAALETDLGEVATVKPAGIEPLDPGQQAREIGNVVARYRGRGNWGTFTSARRSAVRIPHRGTRRRHRYRGHGSGDERTLVAARKHRDVAVGFDPYRHLGADQAQALGTNAGGQQAPPGDSDFRLRRARHDRTVGVAHHDVANAQRRAAAGIALKLRAADLDLMAVTEILLDRRGKPRRREIEFDWPTGQAPPQRRQRDQDHAAERAADDDELPQGRQPDRVEPPGPVPKQPCITVEPAQPRAERTVVMIRIIMMVGGIIMIGGAIVIGCFICVRLMIRRRLVLMDVLVCGVSVMNIRCVIVVARWFDVMRLGISAGIRLVQIGERTCAADVQMRAKARL